MMESEETRTNLSNDTETLPPRGWLKRGLMPLKPASTPAASTSEKAHAFNFLAKVWGTSLREAQPLIYQRPINCNEGFALLGFGGAVGDQAKEAIKFAIANWDDFVSAAKTKYGLFGPQPAEPRIL